MHLHILGICGTFMGGVAALARAAGHRVTGSDANVYPPMSTQLEALGIELMQGYEPAHLQPAPDVVVVGNVVARGNAAMEYVLDKGLPYTSGPQWLAEHVLGQRHVLAVAGTHGKTTTTSMLAWILEACGKQPGFLVGGVPENFGVSARLGEGECFVVEADEYDTAFFDKRSKFVHYHPRTLILNNLEFDHADIFPDLAAIERQFHHLVRTVPGNGLILSNAGEANLERVLKAGCWTPVQRFTGDGEWQAQPRVADGSSFVVSFAGQVQGRVEWALMGPHNVANGLAAIAAAHHAGVDVAAACRALADFCNVRRRLELRGEVGGIAVYDDFAHHPTAIATTLAGLRARYPKQRIIAVLEPRSNSMRMGVHQQALAASLEAADEVFVYRSADLPWSPQQVMAELGTRLHVQDELDALAPQVAALASAGDRVLVMSNGGFGNMPQRLLDAIAAAASTG